MLNKLVTSCIDKHAPSRRVNLNRPINPWMRDSAVVQAQNELEQFHLKARDTSKIEERRKYENNRNRSKKTIKE